MDGRRGRGGGRGDGVQEGAGRREERKGRKGWRGGGGASIALSDLGSPGTKDVGAPPMPTSTGPAPGMVVVKATEGEQGGRPPPWNITVSVQMGRVFTIWS